MDSRREQIQSEINTPDLPDAMANSRRNLRRKREYQRATFTE